MKPRNLSNVSTRALWEELGHRAGQSIPKALLPLVLILASPGYLAMRAMRALIGNDRRSNAPGIAVVLVSVAWLMYLVGSLVLIALGRWP